MKILKLNTDKNYWITSDTHYDHKNICRGVTSWRTPDGNISVNQTRPFSSLSEMNDAIVNNINSVVGADDVLIHLGDWSFGGVQNIRKFRERLFVKTIYIALGNHDQHINKNIEEYLDIFTEINDTYLLYLDKTEIFLSHYPVSSWINLNKGSIHLHGHTHLPNNENNTFGRRMDIGIDTNIGFKPYNLFDCVEKLKNKLVETDKCYCDHHSTNFNTNEKRS